MKFFGTLGIATAIVLLPRLASAQPDVPQENNVQPVRLSYAADSDCPSKEDFVQAIRERGLSIREADDATRAMSVTLVRDSQSGQWNGTMRVHDAHGDAAREVSAGSCADIAHSIALFASLALTPEVEAPPPTPTPPPPAPVRLPTQIPAQNKPVRAITKSPPIESYSLSRHRFSIAPEAIFHLSSKPFEDFAGLGVSGTYHVSDRFGLGLSADLLHTFDDYPTGSISTPQSVVEATIHSSSNVALLRVMVRAPISLHVAHGTLDGRAGSPFDFFVAPSVGTIFTKPDGLPSPVPDSYSPDIAFQIDLGTRMFVTSDFAITAGVGFLFYWERYEQGNYLVGAYGKLESAEFHSSYSPNFGPLFQLGAEFDLPGAPTAR